jgi:SAM-dependent methyltransferase
LRADFDAMMGPAGHGIPNPEIPLTGGWEAVRRVVDVGGGSGAMLAEILRRWPAIQGALVDIPQTVRRAGVVFAAAGVEERATAVGQSFFDPLPPGADVYLLRKVLNDWPDREAEAILMRCAEASLPAGLVLVLGGVSPDEAPRPLTIEMVLLGGKHRSLSEFRALAEKAGLEVTAAGHQPPGQPGSWGHFVVECQPV